MRRSALAFAVFVTIASGAGAQGLPGADVLTPGAVADSQKVLQTLDRRVHDNTKDADAWHRLGMIAWALGDRARAANSPRDLDATRLYHLADSSLRSAADFAPQNAYYRLTVGKFLLASGNPITRSSASGQFDKAIDVARAMHDTATLAEADIEYGRVFWRRYDALENRRLTTGGIDIGRSISDAMQPMARSYGAQAAAAAAGALSAGGDASGDFDMMQSNSMKDVRMTIENATMPLPQDVNGAGDYVRAEQFFRQAYAAAPGNPRTFRAVAMLLADSSRWHELAAMAQEQTRRMPWDPAGWMALGLSLDRQGKSGPAAAAFDSAMSTSSPQEIARLDRLERVLRPLDTARVARAGAADHAALSRIYWLFADPLWSREGNESRIEYLARVEYAELRWTVEELGVRGAETDRGDVFIRYGPPDLIAATGSGVNGDVLDNVTYWLYKSGLMFAFSGFGTYGTARTPNDDMSMVEAIRNAQPVRWDNINELRVDTLPVQVARFRGGNDSVDVLVATRANVTGIEKTSEVKEPVQSWIWLLAGGTVPVYSDSARLDTTALTSWTRRVAPNNYVYRIEATTHTSKRAGRATSQIMATADPRTGFLTRGFGLSDVLLATSVDQIPAGAARWTRFGATPLAGGLAKNSQLYLVWENYDFTQKNGAVDYSVALTIVRDRSGAGRIAAHIAGALASVAQVDSRQSDRVVLRFDRSAPYSAAFADEVDVALGDTPPGAYTLALEVTDKATGRKSTHTTSFIIRE